MALSLAYIASIARITRGSMMKYYTPILFVLPGRKGYLCGDHFTSRIKTCSVTRALLYGPAFVGIITGSMVIETIYGLPGLDNCSLMAH